MGTRVHTENAPAAIGPYSQGVKVANLVYTAGQLALDPKTGRLVDGGIREQTTRALENVKAILEAAGVSMRDVVKTTVYLSDMANYPAMNEVYSQYFNTEPPPARSAVQVAALPLNAMVEVETVAAIES